MDWGVDDPDFLGNAGDVEEAFRVWNVLQAVDWRWTPLDVLNQDEILLHNVLEMAHLYDSIKRHKSGDATER